MAVRKRISYSMTLAVFKSELCLIIIENTLNRIPIKNFSKLEKIERHQ